MKTQILNELSELLNENSEFLNKLSDTVEENSKKLEGIDEYFGEISDVISDLLLVALSTSSRNLLTSFVDTLFSWSYLREGLSSKKQAKDFWFLVQRGTSERFEEH